jgi:nitrite reductase (NADH) small subunit
VIVDLGSFGDFPDGRFEVVTVGDRELGVFRLGDAVWVLRNRCPHQSGPVCEGVVTRKVVATGDVGEMGVDQETPVINCPWHGWEFDARTGHSVWAGRPDSVMTYPAYVAEGRVLVELKASAADVRRVEQSSVS